MAIVRLYDFKGALPGRHPRLIPPGWAAVARDAELRRGDLGPTRADALVETLAQPALTIRRRGGAFLSWDENVVAIEAPIETDDRLYVFGPGRAPTIRFDTGQEVPLAVPTPTAAPGVALASAADPNAIESVYYVYTWVTPYGEESQPSKPSAILAWSSGVVVDLTLPPPPLGDRAIATRRIYRSETDAAGVTSLYFVREIDAAAASWSHDLAVDPMQEIIDCEDDDPPPNGLRGAVVMPNGVIAAFNGRRLLFCEPYRPHAWPRKYRRILDGQILGLVAFGSSLAVMTDANPYIAQGALPETMILEKVEAPYPCRSSRGVVDMGYAGAYPTDIGLVMVSSGGARLVTEGLFTPDQWRALRPDSFVAHHREGRYLFSHLTPDGTARSSGVIDLSGQSPFYVSNSAQVVDFCDCNVTGAVYYLEGVSDGTRIMEIEAGERETLLWRSSLIQTGSPHCFGAIKIETDPSGGGASLSVKVIADGVQRAVVTAADQVARLPGGYLATRWELEIETDMTLTAVVLATTPPEIGRG